MGKYLEALKILYAEDEKVCESPGGGTDKTDESPPDTPFGSNVSSCPGLLENFQAPEEPFPIPFSDHEIAEHKINELRMHEDRVFVRQMLLGIYGKKRLTLVNRYFEEHQFGMDAESFEHKKENTGRYRANVWLRSKLDKSRGNNGRNR